MEIREINCPIPKHWRYSCVACYDTGKCNPDFVICPDCDHSKKDHYEHSYNEKARNGELSECGMEMQFVCGCTSTTFIKMKDYEEFREKQKD